MKNNFQRTVQAGILLSACLFLLLSGCRTSQKYTIQKTNQGGYVLLVKGKPFFAKGVIYNPTPIGKGYEYDFFADPHKPWLYDGTLMQEAGINCIRVYTYGKNLEQVKTFISDMYEKYGIYTIIGDWLGLWNSSCPNYADAEFRKKVKQDVLSVVEALKDQEGLLMWVLGNENNYTCTGNLVFWTSSEIEKIDDPAEKVQRRAEIYYSLVEEIASEIKKVDNEHLVALGNGEATLLNVAAEICKSVDILALIAYRGKKFGNFFRNVQRQFDKPILISEFGADSYDAYRGKEDQQAQSDFIESQWEDIFGNTVFSGNEAGNCIGGVIFEWNDEWWKHNEGYSPDWGVHNTEAGWSNGSYYLDIRAPDNLNMNEEWFGIVSLSEEKENGINKRIPKQAYYTLKRLWSRPLWL